MASAPQTWTLKGLLTHVEFVHHKMPDHAFAWVLGAGASRPSGIPTGAALVDRWLKELHERLDSTGSPLETWATAANLGIEKFEVANAASFYPRIYERRFQDNPEEGHAYLEDLMASIEPSPGYSILAKTMEKERHRVVITTNFDNLVADAMAIYTTTYPFVCGHESLTSFVRSAVRRPLVCKIHRDLLLGPKNDPRSLKRLHEAWAGTLRTLLAQYTPIFVGYGGNDDSLMDLFESLEPGEIRGQLIWCYYEASAPSDRIRELVAQHRGALVPVPDFDILMLLIGARMKIEPLDDVLGARAQQRLERYRGRILSLDLVRYPDLIPALSSAFERAKIEWWTWEAKARSKKDPAEREEVYRAGIQRCPKSHELCTNFAEFLWRVRKNVDEAEKFYRRALDLAPNKAINVGNFAVFMSEERNNADEAEKLYRRAVELEPNHATIVGNLAYFMSNERKNADEAEKLYRRALELDPNHGNNLGNFASFLINERKNTDEAEKFYRRAIALDPNHADNLGSFALFMINQRKNADEAERLFRRAVELAPNNAQVLGSFGHFMSTKRKNGDEAEELLRRAVELAPDDPTIIGYFAYFMFTERKNANEAEKFYRRAIELDPKNANSLGNFANLINQQHNNAEEAEKLYRRAIELDPRNADNVANFAGFLVSRDRLDEARPYVERALILNGWSINPLTGESLFYRSLIDQCSGQDPSTALGQLKSLLQSGYTRGPWSFAPVLETARKSLPPEDLTLYEAIADALLDANRTTDLDRFERWQTLPPAALGPPQIH